jgi:phosphohistidine swiveling domain-containing protein
VLLPKISKFSDEQLVREFSDFVHKYFHCYALGCITFLYEGILSEKIAASLSQRNYPVTEILEKLLKTGYKSFLIESEKMLFSIKQEKQKNIKENLIQRYIRNYFFIDTSYSESPIMDKSAVQKKLKHLETFVQDSVPTKNNPSEMQAEVKLNQNEKLMIELLKSAEFVRDQRKQVAMIGVYAMIRFLDEAVKRRKLDRSIVERAFWYEFSDLLFLPKKIIPILKKRKRVSVVLNENNIFYLDYDAIQPSNKIRGKAKAIKGTPAAKGKITGIVRIILGKKEFHKLKKGEILVTEMTRPDFIPILKLAGAIVTDEGGLTSHAAIVSRELGIPCIVGTKIGTRVLHDGDLVEVDAGKGLVRLLRKKRNE